MAVPSSSIPSSRLAGIRVAAAAALGLVLAVFLGGCAGDKASGMGGRVASRTGDGLELVKRGKNEVLWVKPDHHLGRYDDVIIQVAGPLYGAGQPRLKDSEERQIRALVFDVLRQLTATGPVGLTRTPGPCTVVVNVGVKDLRLRSVPGAGATTSIVYNYGTATLVVEFRDSLTDTPLLRYMAARGLGGGPGTGVSGVNLKRLGEAIGALTRGMLDELAIVVPSTTAKQEHQCRDGIYALTGRG